MESGVCGCVSEFDIAGTGAVYIKAYGGTLCFFLPDARAHDQSRRQKTALLQAEIRKAVKRSVVAGSSFDRLFPPTHPNAQERGDLWARIAMGVSVGTSFRVIWSWSKSVN